MKTREINLYPIHRYLANLNIHPAKDRGYYGMYHSPFREDHNASMKVDYNKNLWIDYGANEGGTLIDLAMKINNCTNGEAMRLLEKHIGGTIPDSFSFQRNISNETTKEDPRITILKAIPLSHPSLGQYLNKRSINTDAAKLHCKEVHYSVNNRNYFAVGFLNNSEGYELRSEYFQGCTNKDITTYSGMDTNKESCLIFEGFMDYLSYLTLKNMKVSKQDAVILNSVHNLPKAMDFIKLYPKVYCYLDNDEAGRNATQQINKWSRTQGCTHIDKSTEYSEYKDLNEYLVSTKQIQLKEKPVIQEKRKPSRGFRP